MSNEQKWLIEIDRYLPVKKLFFIHGNIYDKIPYPSKEARGGHIYEPLREIIKTFFVEKGYQVIGFYDIVDGFSIFRKQDKGEFNNTSKKAELPKALDNMYDILKANIPAIFVIDYSSRLCQLPDQLNIEENKIFLKILKCSKDAAQVMVNDCRSNNVLFLICDKFNDIPAWLYLNNPEAKTLVIEKPDIEERKLYIEKNFHAFLGHDELNKEVKEKITNQMADLTDGLCIIEISSLSAISRRENKKITDDKSVKDIIDKYKYGEIESHWQKEVLIPKLEKAIEVLPKRVKGQGQAIHAVLDIIKRASMGLSGVQHSTSASKPRGVLFFAGPTGVGKTELAKALADVLFSDEKACIRFDMSEYSLEHADQKLLGAPPGYLGYQAGGQLTDKIRERPFSVLLFDEIEKAHPSILDKFLQILEDGRLTDGKGETVYFSEAILIFTSNLGAYVDEPIKEVRNGKEIVVGHERKKNISPTVWQCTKCNNDKSIYISDKEPKECAVCEQTNFKLIEMPYSMIKEKILNAIKDYFNTSLNRPELLNRFGNNFVVFDYIRPAVIEGIIKKILDDIEAEIKNKHEIDIDFSEEVKLMLFELAQKNIEHGGRGIGNIIEERIVNPLARKLFDDKIEKGHSLAIKGIQTEREGHYSLITI